MRRHVFLRILNGVQSVDTYFQQREDCTGLLGLNALQKVVAAIRILAYGHMFSLHMPEERHLQLSSQSMGMHMTWGTTLLYWFLIHSTIIFVKVL
jgi:hypothetical protein